MTTKLTTEQFISKAKLVHGDRYDYELVEYINNRTKLIIVCREHGQFEQKPASHLQGKGCPSCTVNRKLITETFIQKATLVHNNKYSYDLVEYVNNKTKVKIICPTHGQFEQSPSHHLNKAQECAKCAHEAKALVLSNQAKLEFKDKSNIVHNNKYDYSLVEYVNNYTKIKIICSDHGTFEQVPKNHINGKQGCPHCALSEKGFSRSKFKSKCDQNNNGLGILYILGCWDDNKSEVFIKIGITSRSIQKRYNSTQAMPYNFKVLHEIVGDPEYIYNLETLLHNKSSNYRYTPAIPFSGSSFECFIANKSYLSKLNSYMSECIPF